MTLILPEYLNCALPKMHWYIYLIIAVIFIYKGILCSYKVKTNMEILIQLLQKRA